MKSKNIKEFVDEGYLCYINNQILHPLGLALTVESNNDECALTVQQTDDPGGIIFDYYNLLEHEQKDLRQKIGNVKKVAKNKAMPRTADIGSFIEDIPTD